MSYILEPGNDRTRRNGLKSAIRLFEEHFLLVLLDEQTKEKTMKGKSVYIPSVLLLLAIPSHATIILDDGLDHFVSSSVADNIHLSNGSQLHISRTGSVTGPGSSSPLGALGAISIGGEPTTWVPKEERNQLIVSDNARVVGTQGRSGVTFRSGYSDVRVQDSGYVSSIGTVVVYGGWDEEALSRVFLGDRATVGNVTMTGFVSMADNARITGDLRSDGPLAAWLNGGIVQGELLLGQNDLHSISLDGTSILGGLRSIASTIRFEMKDGIIGGNGMQIGGAMFAAIYGGHIDGGLRRGDNAFYGGADKYSFFGGSLDAGASDWLINLNAQPYSNDFSLLDIRGGQFGYGSGGNGFLLDGRINFDIYGWDLRFSNDRLTGFLADGNYIDVGLTLGSSWQGSMSIHDVSVPEPGTLMLFVLALAGLFVIRRSPRATQTQVTSASI